ncbi:Transcription factor IIIB 60 kDa subunit [Schizosaccharomyces pombe]|uniref:Transcription factor IIIB 60 kDa subunit n=1 Tax=Schizosaccharomyces pombe (strain 972 / ATCC 24843) TaxID=284812 RepID=TF3B_SCHPO|nr:transcription factor TFIIIB subunit Brf1 [Schizosaccharomyces pombe]Q9P6R0.2 RecName: Full=Transcription factor IIIB 60 kDa subunit; Short=TFIIIB; AltName: Full=B-related factor 1; Short=BRF-1; AltName: Full=TFIIB-related factor [Schizosaccharomyces pombe 972h-]CAB89885.2 transcription factor TFIIIB complex subunit Brf1 [Schizosaccharomyces pombe]|eukprot:NP_001342959.1 transcription factor TFIIIB subunit Brf1 [Schizosaccharomyces pombe]
MGCPNCGSTTFESDTASGNTYCTQCGVVVEQDAIVSEVTFGEASTGAAVVQGSLVSNDQTHARTFGGPYRNQGSVESRELTIANGRRRISALAIALKLNERHIEAAVRYFTLAINNNFIKGRRSQYVVASCLYIVCRISKTSHMLIDFSDILQINVFKLGSTFLKLCRVLRPNLPLLDPSLYISRFASLLEFGPETHRVANDAIRLVARMNRDWMQIGRRPAGICGACLLIAARMNNFRRSVREVVHVVKVADITIQKRLDEFKLTESGDLSIADFRNIWLEGQSDPPSFTKNQKFQQYGAQKVSNIDHTQEYMSPIKRTPDFDGNEVKSEELSQTVKVESQETPVHLKADEREIRKEVTETLKGDELRKISLQVNVKFSEEEVTLEDVDDDEIEDILLDKDEILTKTQVWMELNKDYLAEEEAKNLKLQEDLKKGIVRQPRKRRRYRPRDSTSDGIADTAAESAKEMMQQRAFSKKINYEALDMLFDEEQS